MVSAVCLRARAGLKNSIFFCIRFWNWTWALNCKLFLGFNAITSTRMLCITRNTGLKREVVNLVVSKFKLAISDEEGINQPRIAVIVVKYE
jgi:hypothetical protein